MTDALLQVILLGLGIVWGFLLSMLAASWGRSSVLERRRWKAIWANERWLKELTEKIDLLQDRLAILEGKT